MFRKLFGIVITLFSFSSFACTDALPTDDINFCASFKIAAVCYCAESLPGCSRFSMSQIYSLLITRYKTLESACASQQHTDPQTCIDDWNCYRLGGIDSQGRSCSSTQLPCQ